MSVFYYCAGGEGIGKVTTRVYILGTPLFINFSHGADLSCTRTHFCAEFMIYKVIFIVHCILFIPLASTIKIVWILFIQCSFQEGGKCFFLPCLVQNPVLSLLIILLSRLYGKFCYLNLNLILFPLRRLISKSLVVAQTLMNNLQ